MTKPTKEEMLKELAVAFQGREHSLDIEWDLLDSNSKENLVKVYAEAQAKSQWIYDAIRTLIENMDKRPKASKGFVEGWAEHFFLAGQEAIEKGICWNTYKALIPCVEEMFAELGLEVEEEK